MVAASRAGVFGMVLIGLCSLILGLMSRIVPMEPMVYFASMAGVLFPAAMVAAGMLARWASEDMGISRGRTNVGPIASLTAGLVAVTGGAILCIFTLISPLSGVLRAGLSVEPGATGYLGLAVLFTAYLAISVIGGALYAIVVPSPPLRY